MCDQILGFLRPGSGIVAFITPQLRFYPGNELQRVANLVGTITRYESILQAKLQNVSTQMEDCALTEEI